MKRKRIKFWENSNNVIDRTDLLPSLTNAMATTIRLRSIKTTKKMMRSTTPLMIDNANHVLVFPNQDSANLLRLVAIIVS